MVHQTISTSNARASKASSRISSMNQFTRWKSTAILGTQSALLAVFLVACGTVPLPPEEPASLPDAKQAAAPSGDDGPLPATLTRGKSRWVPVPWRELPGLEADALHEAWNAWIRSCERPAPPFAALCPQVRRLSIATREEQQAWMMRTLQPYRVEPLQAGELPLLTAYYEPVMDASRQPTASHRVPLYRTPADLAQRRPWYTRQEMETLPEARAALRGREIAWLTDPIDALVLQIQGSGRLRITEPDGRQRLVRLAYDGVNDQPYRSVGGWLLQQGLVKDATWPGIKDWVRRNPDRVNEMLWSNPRMVFFREEPLDDMQAASGPRGAQGVALTPGRSIAVDRESIPYGTPVWLASSGPQVSLQRLVLAQDTGSAIVGGVRADYFVGWGEAAGEVAGRLKQPLRLWVLWPR